MYSLSVIIPMYNEEQNAPVIINHVVSFLSSYKGEWEVIVVESGSTDHTLSVVRDIAAANPRIHVLHQEQREGMGSALRLGYSHCRHDLIWHVESDSPFDANNVSTAIPLFDRVDFVAGYRIGERESFMRWLYSFVYNRLIRHLFGLRVKDVNFSFKIFKRSILEKITLHSTGWFIDAELLVETQKRGFIIGEIPIPYTMRVAGSSTVSLFTPLPILKELLNYRLTYYRS
jgi:glycosyltransferase involved in cell wall biosynthesis